MSPLPKLAPEQAADLVRRKAAGESVTDLCARFGVTRPTVAKYLRDAGLPPRPRRPRTADDAPAAPRARRKAQDPADSRPFPDATKGYIPTPCEDPTCGQPADIRTYPPAAGRVRARTADSQGVECCSWYCLARVAIRLELRGGAA